MYGFESNARFQAELQAAYDAAWVTVEIEGLHVSTLPDDYSSVYAAVVERWLGYGYR